MSDTNNLSALVSDAAKRKMAEEALGNLRGGDQSTAKADNVLPDTYLTQSGERLPVPKFQTKTGEVFGRVVGGLQSIDTAAEAFSNTLLSGIVRSGAGAVQAIVDQFSPESGAKIGKTIDEAAPVPEGLGGQATQFAGEVLPYMVAPLSPLAGTLLAGVTSLQTDRTGNETTGDTNLTRVEGAGIGAVGYGALKGVSKLVTRFANTSAGKKALSEVTDRIKAFSDRAVETDEALIPSRSKINADLEKKQSKFNADSERIRVEADIRGPVPMENLDEEFKLTRAEINKIGSAGDKKATDAVKNVVSDFAPLTEEPEKITSRNGITLTRIGPMKYELPGGKVVSGNAAQQLVGAWKRQRPGALLSQIRGHVERLDEVLADNPGSSDPAVVQAGKLRNILQSKVDEFTPPHIKAQTTRLEKFYENQIAQYKSPAVDKILQSQDPLERANLSIKVATGTNVRDAETVAGILGKSGKEGIFGGTIKKAMDDALDPETKVIDPEKFAEFMSRPTIKPFMNLENQRVLEGIKNLISEAKDLGAESGLNRAAGGGKLGRLQNYAVHAGTWGTIWSLMEGNLQHAAVGAMTTGLTYGAFTVFDRMMADGFGRRLLMAAGEAKPGTPKFARLTQLMVEKFGAPASGVAGGQMSQ